MIDCKLYFGNGKTLDAKIIAYDGSVFTVQLDPGTSVEDFPPSWSEIVIEESFHSIALILDQIPGPVIKIVDQGPAPYVRSDYRGRGA
jgi:hypothetical protein